MRHTYHAAASRDIAAPAALIYGLISDYHKSHQAILPRRFFTDMTVTKGGQGARTEITVEMNVYGAHAVYHMTVTEPQPGRLLQEVDEATGVTTSFHEEPLADGTSRVTIASDVRPRPGLAGLLEKWFNPAILRRIYREELQQLAALAESQ